MPAGKPRRRLIGPPQVRLENRQLFEAAELFLGLGAVTFVVLIVLFLLLGLHSLLVAAVPGLVLFIATLLINRRDRHDMALVLALSGTLALAVLAVTHIGWAAGFQYYIVLAALLIFLPPGWPGAVQVLFSGAACALYLALRVHALGHAPSAAAESDSQELFHLLNAAVLFLGVALLARFYRSAARIAEAKLKISFRELERSARTDPLTLLLNRRGITERMEVEAIRGKRSGSPFAMVLADIDDFHEINDRFGHDHGDGVLMTLANLMDEVLREQDQVARWSGEQFMMVLPETDLDGGTTAADRVRQRIAEHPIFLEGEPYEVTLTYGVSTWTKQKRIEDTVREAEHALQLGKEAGKDRVVSSGEG